MREKKQTKERLSNNNKNCNLQFATENYSMKEQKKEETVIEIAHRNRKICLQKQYLPLTTKFKSARLFRYSVKWFEVYF